MSDLIAPHGKQEKLIPLLLEGSALKAETERAKKLKTNHHHHPGDLGPDHDGDRGLHPADRFHGQGRLEGRLRQVS